MGGAKDRAHPKPTTAPRNMKDDLKRVKTQGGGGLPAAPNVDTFTQCPIPTTGNITENPIESERFLHSGIILPIERGHHSRHQMENANMGQAKTAPLL